MNENSNDPTSFQAGEPDKAGKAFQAGAPSESEPPFDADDLRAAGAPSQQDRAIEALKAYEPYGLAVGVVVQLLVLFGMIVIGAMKWAAGGF